MATQCFIVGICTGPPRKQLFNWIGASSVISNSEAGSGRSITPTTSSEAATSIADRTPFPTTGDQGSTMKSDSGTNPDTFAKSIHKFIPVSRPFIRTSGYLRQQLQYSRQSFDVVRSAPSGDSAHEDLRRCWNQELFRNSVKRMQSCGVGLKEDVFLMGDRQRSTKGKFDLPLRKSQPGALPGDHRPVPGAVLPGVRMVIDLDCKERRQIFARRGRHPPRRRAVLWRPLRY